MDRRILRLDDIEKKTGIPKATLRYYRHLGEGPPTWILAGRVCAYEDEVDQWIENQRQSSRGQGAQSA